MPCSTGFPNAGRHVDAVGATYDTGALIAAEANRRDVWVLHARLLQRGVRPVVPAAVLAQAWRGGPQPALSRLLRGCRVEDLDESRARVVGVVCARSGTHDVVDAVVVAGAFARDDIVLTSDSTDLERIAGALGGSLRCHRV